MTRLLTALGLIAFAVYLVFFAPPTIFVLGAGIIALLCYVEYARLIAAHGIRKPGIFGVLLGASFLLFPYRVFILAPLLVGLQLATLMRRRELREVAPEVACSLLGAVYAIAPWRFAIDLRNASVHLLFFALALNWVGDSTAFFVGRRFGRHKLAPLVSPAKTLEGSAASVLMSALFGWLYLRWSLPDAGIPAIVIMAVCGNIAGQVGDLVESSIKRGAGLKDSGTWLPGHGGALDRLDSSLFTLPVIFALSLVLL